jgi:hypothetical protein
MIAQTQDSSESAFPTAVINGIKIPQSHKEAVNDPRYADQWKAAMAGEILSLVANGTWKEVILPKGANLVSTTWVCTIKTMQMDQLRDSKHDLWQEVLVRYMDKTILKPLLPQLGWIP